MATVDAEFLATAAAPTRVLVSAAGEAVPADEARARSVVWRVVYVRDDGYSLGASMRLARRARRLWDGQWVAVVVDGKVTRLGRGAVA